MLTLKTLVAAFEVSNAFVFDVVVVVEKHICRC
jgi:hypothetical protein